VAGIQGMGVTSSATTGTSAVEPSLLATPPQASVHTTVKELVETHAIKPMLVRPVVGMSSADSVEKPDALFGPVVMALTAIVEPMNLFAVSEDIMLYPDPRTYADVAASHRLIAPAGASYQTQLTMGNVIGTVFQSQQFYTGALFSKQEEAKRLREEIGQQPAGAPLNRPTRKKKPKAK